MVLDGVLPDAKGGGLAPEERELFAKLGDKANLAEAAELLK